MTPKQFKQNRLSIISELTGKPITQRELAKRLGLSPKNGANYIRMIEKGKREPSNVLIKCFEYYRAVEAVLACYNSHPSGGYSLLNYKKDEIARKAIESRIFLSNKIISDNLKIERAEQDQPK